MSILKKLYNKSKEEKGFTLVELIVVLVIIAILAAILVPSLMKYIDTAKQKQVTIDARTAYLGIQTAAAEEYAADGIGETAPATQKLPTPESNDDVAERAKKYVEGIQKTYNCEFAITSKGAITSFKYESDSTIVELVSGGSLQVQ